MNEQEHAEWVAQATGQMVTRSAGPHMAAGNDAWNRYFAEQRKRERAYINKSLEEVVYGMGLKFAELDVALRAKIQQTMVDAREELVGMRETRQRLEHEIEALRAELAEVRKAMPLRAVSSKSA